MSPRPASWIATLRAPLIALAVVLAIVAVTWADLNPTERAGLIASLTGARLALIGLLTASALALLGLHLHRVAAATRKPALRIAEAIGLAAGSNPAHRIAPQGTPELCAIAEAANELAAQRARLLVDVEASITEAKARVEEEKNRFAALVSELDQSVLVCNRDGRILLYNAAVSALLAPNLPDGVQALGLGRSVFGLIDRSLILHAVEAIETQSARGERESVHFVTASADGRLLRVQVAPVFGGAARPPEPAAGAAAPPARTVTGFVLLLSDVTESIESDARSVALFQDLVEATRGAIASIRAAIEALVEHPDLDTQRRVRFTSIVQDEAVRLSDRLDRLSADVSERLRRRWPLEEMRGVDLLSLASRRIERRKGLTARLESIDSDLWLRVDSFTLAQALSSLAGRLHEEFEVREVRFRLRAGGAHAQLDMAWRGVPMSSETAFTWQNDAFTLGGEDSPLSLAQVMDRHGGEAWYQRDVPSQTNYFRLLLPLASEHAASRARQWRPNRPEFYDFDLFHHSTATDAFDARRLADLTYTVFDTETTGLDPVSGDEIISIGATRIVNGRLLQAETFESLVDPQRAISQASIEVHGITPDLLVGQPVIAQVLPRFWRFAEDTVLVGHNAAFDMRFLQLKEAQTGVKFQQPVLDTLLLAAVVHPSEESHALEAVASRLGIAVIGRHTALGDALATAEVFLRLIPLLAAQGIHTLGHARAASEKTYYARLKY
jgi:DNA polymerase-3 subunit epsilon